MAAWGSVTIETLQARIEKGSKQSADSVASMTTDPERPDIPSELLIDALEALNEGIAIYDAEERLVICNGRYKELLGPLKDMIVPGMQWRDLIHSCVEKGMVSSLHESGEDWLSTSEAERGRFAQETEIRQTDGRTFHISYHPTKSGGFVVTRSDITERRNAENMARDREALLTTIMDTNPTPVIMARMDDSRIIYRSPAAIDLYGEVDYARDYFVDPGGRAEYLAKLKENDRVHDERFKVRAAGGRERVVSLSGGLTEYNGAPHVVTSVTDITERLEREALIRKVVESCPASIVMSRLEDGEILFTSPSFDAVLGPATHTPEFYVNPEDRAGFLDTLTRKREIHDYRVQFWNTKRQPTWFAVSARLIEWEGEEVTVAHTRDLTDELAIEDELSQQREQVFQSEKMSALGGLLAGVAHELNNPLSVVVGHALMLQDEATDPDIQRQIGKISNAAARCAKIVKTFLTMARQSPVVMDRTDVNDVVSTAVEVARYGDSPSGAEITFELEPDLAPICIDADQVTQVLINLILNAEQAIGNSGVGGQVQVRTERGASEREVRVIVEDDGPGIPKDIRARVFDPFFTTKEVGEGTGIGLSVCHRIVSAHNGSITLEWVKPHGARFVVTLPCNASTEPDDPKQNASLPEPTAARVLVVDDEIDVADLNAEVLARGGFEVEVAYKGEDAIEKLRSTSFDAIISDLNMPGIDGRGFHELIRSDFPDLLNHTGYVTGDTMGRSSQGFLRESRRPYLEKPVSPKELRTFVARLCEGEGPR